MFEVGFTEILLICGLALIVLGPQRLPKLAAQIGRWVGRARSMARQFRDQLDAEVELGEERRAYNDGRDHSDAGADPEEPPPSEFAPSSEPAPTASVSDPPTSKPDERRET